MVRSYRRMVTAAAAAAAVVSLTALAGASPAVAAPAAPAGQATVLPPPPPLHAPGGGVGAAGPLQPGPGSPWVPLAHQPPFYPGTMLLQSDGSVLVQASTTTGGGTDQWFRLTPNAQGSYVDGTWSVVPPMPGGYDPLYFASAVLPDGKMIVEGGEYLGTTSEWTNEGAIYDPTTNSWAPVAPPRGWANIGDAQSEVLPNGTFMLAQSCQNCLTPDGSLSDAVAFFNPRTNGWTQHPVRGKHDPNDEEGWSLLPDNRLLTVDTWAPPATETFTPSRTRWTSAGATASTLVNTGAKEIGPQVEMPGGNTFVVGAGTSPTQTGFSCVASTIPAPTGLYDYAAGTWVAGPSIPTVNGEQYDSADGPASILPDGNVLFGASPCVYHTTLVFYLYDAASNSLSPVPGVPHAGTDSAYFTRLLALPNGQVLFNDGTQMLAYTAGGTPNPAWAPSIQRVSTQTLAPGVTASLSGTQLAGLSQGAAYGDDVQDNTNFPLVRVTNRATGVVTYARTKNWTSVSIAPGARSATQFTLPPTTPAGPSTLVVVANGIASAPLAVTIT